MANLHERIPVPGFYVGETYTPGELLMSTKNWTQDGCTLAGGQGEVLLGSIIARDPVSKKYYKVDANEGFTPPALDPPDGLLRESADLRGPADQLGDRLYRGDANLQKVKEANSDATIAAFVEFWKCKVDASHNKLIM